MASVLNTRITIRLNDEFTKNLQKMRGAAAKFAADVKKSFSDAIEFAGKANQAAENFERWSSGMRRMLEAPVGAAMDYEHALNVLATKSGATAEEMATLRDLSMSLDQTSPTLAVEAMTAMATDGQKAVDILQNFQKVLNLATAADAPERFAEVSDKIGNLAAAFGLDDLERAGDVMTYTFGNAATDFFELAEAMVQAGPAAVATGQSFEFANAALAALAGGGMKGAMAGTALRQALVKLVPQSKRAQQALRKVGVEVTDSEGNFRSAVDILEDLASATGAMSEKQQVSFLKNMFGEEAFAGISVLLQAAREGSIRQMVEDYESIGGITQRTAERMRNDSLGSLRALQTQFEKLKIELGNEMLPTVVDLMETFKPVIQELTAWVKENPDLARSLAKSVVYTTALTTAVGPLLRTLGVLRLGMVGPKGLMGASFKLGNALAGSGGLVGKLGAAGLLGALSAVSYQTGQWIAKLTGLDSVLAELIHGEDQYTDAEAERAAAINKAFENARAIGAEDLLAGFAGGFSATDEGREMQRRRVEEFGEILQQAMERGGSRRDQLAYIEQRLRQAEESRAQRAREIMDAPLMGPAADVLEGLRDAGVDVNIRVEAEGGARATVTRTRTTGSVNLGDIPVGAF